MNPVRKKISRNDLNLTGGHQSGIVVPKAAVDLFPKLEESTENPRLKLVIEDQEGRRSSAVYIHYNNRVTGGGTRDEYRLTRMGDWFSANKPRAGDWIVFLPYAEAVQPVHHEMESMRGDAESEEEFESVPEGAKSIRVVNAYERSEKNRRAVLERHGYRCQACGLLLEEAYGEVAKDYAHVHHTKPLSEIGQEYTPDLAADFAVLCPNCHAIAHRRSPALSVAEVRAAYKVAVDQADSPLASGGRGAEAHQGRRRERREV